MLSKLRVKNFKLLKNLTLDFRQRNVLIGPNKSGKSTILQSLEFVAHAISTGNISEVLGGGGGFSEISWKGNPVPKPIRIELSGDDRPQISENGTPTRFRYVLEFGLNTPRALTILEESLVVENDGKKVALIEASRGQGIARRLDGEIVFKNPESDVKPFLAYEIPGWEADTIRRYISGWQFFSLIPQLPKIQPTPAAAQGFLERSGQNLSSWLHTIQGNYPKAFEQIVAVTKEAFPEISSLTAPVTQAGTTYVSMGENMMKRPISIFHGSEGEVKFLQLLSLILYPYRVPLVGIEEPENHLHPRLLQLLVETYDRVRIEAGKDAAQILVTTHSPYFVDLLQPEDVVVVEKQEGATRCERAEDKAHLKKLLEDGELSFGQLWYSGALGGV